MSYGYQDCDISNQPLSCKVAETFSKNINNFYINNLLEDNLIQLLKDGREKLEFELKTGIYYAHKGCRDRYNPSKLKRLINAKKRKVSSGTPSINTRSSYPNTAQFRELCMYCDKPGHEDENHPGRSEPLHAAAGKKKHRDYVEQFTAKVKQIAVDLEDSRMINLLDQDVRSSELFYHRICHVDYIRKHEKYISEKDLLDNSEIDKYVAFGALADHVKKATKKCLIFMNFK